jgi:hypothetical protein
MTRTTTRLIGAALGACRALGGAVALLDSSASAAIPGTRVTGHGQRNHEFLTVDIKISSTGTSGIAAMGYVNGGEVCTYATFDHVNVSGDHVSFNGTGSCTTNKPGYSHRSAHHRFSITNVPGGHDLIDVNSLADSNSGITIPGGEVTVGTYYIVR